MHSLIKCLYMNEKSYSIWERMSWQSCNYIVQPSDLSRLVSFKLQFDTQLVTKDRKIDREIDDYFDEFVLFKNPHFPITN